jgi:hypothetical protein
VQTPSLTPSPAPARTNRRDLWVGVAVVIAFVLVAGATSGG